jgi:hypothetical protein
MTVIYFNHKTKKKMKQEREKSTARETVQEE